MRIARTLLALWVAIMFAACVSSQEHGGSPGRAQPAPAAPTGAPTFGPTFSANSWQRLRRPLHFPHLKPGARCPRTSGVPSAQLTQGLCCYALGHGPVWPVLAGPIVYNPAADMGRHSVVHYVRQPHTPWFAIKTIWFAERSFDEQALVRGRQLDGHHIIKFATDSYHPNELHPRMRLWWGSAGSPKPPLNWAGPGTWVPAPGCYAFQVDTPRLSRVIVFEARLYRGP